MQCSFERLYEMNNLTILVHIVHHLFDIGQIFEYRKSPLIISHLQVLLTKWEAINWESTVAKGVADDHNNINAHYSIHYLFRK